ncbi:MAG: lipopolysaccharide biosynthesis protein [Alphaproteobacteria bacterium]|nr:lipopolysaccharide biosynthesis protein [Alphaproteobacteria bacterium]
MSGEVNGKDPGSGSHMLRGSVWMIALRWSLRGIGVVSTIVLARLLTPSDFGVVAIAMIVVGFFEMLNRTGQGNALIRLTNPTREHYDTAWTISVLIGSAIAVGVVAAAPLTKIYFHEARSVVVMQCLALRALLDGAQNIGTVDFRRDLRFKMFFHFQVSTKIFQFVLTITLALLLRNYWALVGGIVGGQIARTALSYVLSSYRPRFCLKAAREIWSFSIWTFVRSIATYFQDQVDNIAIGGIAGAPTMGRYTVAKDVGSSPTAEITEPIIAALYPVMAKYQSDPAELRRLYLRTLGWSAMICASTGVGILLVARDLVSALLGPQWMTIVPFIGWLALGTAAETLRSGAYATLDVLGLPGIGARMQWVRLILLAVAIIPVAYITRDLISIAVARFVMAALFIPTLYTAVGGRIGVSASQYISALWRPFLATGVMALAVGGLNLVFPTTGLLRLGADVVVGVATYGASLLLFWDLSGRPMSAEQDLVKLLDQGRARFRRLASA